jgi:hypothetical protein
VVSRKHDALHLLIHAPGITPDHAEGVRQLVSSYLADEAGIGPLPSMKAVWPGYPSPGEVRVEAEA